MRLSFVASHYVSVPAERRVIEASIARSDRSKRHVRPQPVCHRQQHKTRQQQQQQCLVVTCSTLQEDSNVIYEWSWDQTKSSLPDKQSDFDLQHPLSSQISTQDALGLLGKAAISEQPPSQQWLQHLLSVVQLSLEQYEAADVCQLLQHLAQLDYTPQQQWMTVVLAQLTTQVQQLSTQHLSALLWTLSDLRLTPTEEHWQALLHATQAKLQDFYGPDLAQLMCAAGSIYNSSNSSYDPNVGSQSTSTAGLGLPDGWCEAVAAEVEYQVCEFVGDLSAFDLARIASGMADLRIQPNSKLQDALLKAVYMRTRTIEEKGAVDFALAKLDAKGKKSMHYDPRWTHEELKWLPRRERDKRRIIKENWYRTQWGGYGSGSKG